MAAKKPDAQAASVEARFVRELKKRETRSRIVAALKELS